VARLWQASGHIHISIRPPKSNHIPIKPHSPTKTTITYLSNIHHPTIMQFIASTRNFTYKDPQPRDGGAPNPSARLRSSSSMLARSGNETQPRDGG